MKLSLLTILIIAESAIFFGTFLINAYIFNEVVIGEAGVDCCDVLLGV